VPVRQLYANPKSLSRGFHTAHLRACAAISAGCFINPRPVLDEADRRNRTQVDAAAAANAFFCIYAHMQLIVLQVKDQAL
jgi:hypothetical protein